MNSSAVDTALPLGKLASRDGAVSGLLSRPEQADVTSIAKSRRLVSTARRASMMDLHETAPIRVHCKRDS
jgi:hypothetical protein